MTTATGRKMRTEKSEDWGTLSDAEAARLRKVLGEMTSHEAEKHFGITITTLARAAAGLSVHTGTVAVARAGLASS